MKMKMRILGLMAFVLLSISILSINTNDLVFGDDHNIPPISASTELPTYGNGDRVVFSGDIRDYDSSIHSGQAVTYVVLSDDSRVLIGQVVPNSDGSFQDNFVAGGPLWKTNGDYTIQLHFGSIEGEAKLVYTGGIFAEPPPTSEPPLQPDPEPPLQPDPEPPLQPDPEPIPDPEPPSQPDPLCGPGTELVNGICTVIKEEPTGTGGCLIATAAYGTEMAPQVQFLREIRDNTVLSTSSGAAFMTGFNQLYYSFSPTIADMERENPMFQEAVRVFITPMISTLSIMTLAEGGSEAEVLGLGLSVIALNLGMYIAAPALIGFKVHRHIKSRN